MQISNEIITVLEYLCQKIGLTIDWTSNKVLPYLEQLCEKYILWETYESLAWIAIMWAVTLILFVVSICITKLKAADGFEWTIFVCALLLAFIVTSVQIMDIVKCKTFPEMMIYEYIKNIAQNM